MRLERIGNGKDKREFVKLYETAFPSQERKPFGFMEELVRAGKMDMLAILDGVRFVGLAIVLLAGKAALLDYFAISSSLRNCGYGGQALELLLRRYGDRRMILEIEAQDPQADNALERQKRKAFYLRNHVKETGIYAHVYGTDFELLSSDGKLSYGEYVQALEDSMGAACVEKLCPRQILKKSTADGTGGRGEK